MRLGLFSFIILLSLQLVAADTTKGAEFSQLCSAVTKYLSCNNGIPIPYAKIRYGQVSFFKPNPCKTKWKYNLGFGIKGWTCVPGTDEIKIQAPVGIDIGLITRSMCDVVSASLGVDANAISDMQKRIGGVCQCVPEILSVLDKDGMTALLSSTEISEGTSGLMTAFGKFGQCAVTAGFTIQDNREALLDGYLASTSSALVFKAAEIDLARYISFATAISTCFVGGACDVPAITQWFTTYLQDSEALIKDQVIGVLKPWSQAFAAVEGNFQTIATSTQDIGTQIDGLGKNATSIIADFCPNIDQCASNTAKDFDTQVKKALELGKQTAELNAVVVGTVSDAKAVVDIIDQAVAAFEALDDISVQGLIDSVLSGTFNGLEDLAGSLKAAQKLPSILDSIQGRLPKLNQVFTQLQDKGPEFANSLQSVLSDNWLGNFEGDAATAEKMKTGIYEVQVKMAGLIPQANDLWNSVSFLSNAVGSIASGKLGNVELRIASYNRWTTGWFDMPCLTTGTITFRILEFTATANYPKFYRCRQDYVVSFPNHHIPYIKLEFASDSPLPQIESAKNAPTTSITWSGTKPTGDVTSASVSSLPVTSTEASMAPSEVPSTPAGESPSPSADVSTESSVPSPSVSDAPASVEPPSVEPTAPPSTEAVAPSTDAITVAPATKRAVHFGFPRFALFRRQDENANTEIDIPFALPTDMVTDSAAAASTATASADTTAVYIETDGTTQQIQTQVTGTPIETEVVPDPQPTQPPTPTETGPFAQATEMTNAEEVVTSWEDVKTLAANATIETTLSDAGSTPVSTANPSASGTASSTASATGQPKSDACALGLNWTTIVLSLAMAFAV